MQPSQLTGTAKSNVLLLKKGDRQFCAEVCFTDLQSIGQIDCDLHCLGSRSRVCKEKLGEIAMATARSFGNVEAETA
jgi:hypothetical protein